MQNLVKAAKELNEIMGLSPAIKLVGIKKEELLKRLEEAAELLLKDDILTPETTKTLEELGFLPVTEKEESLESEVKNAPSLQALKILCKRNKEKFPETSKKIIAIFDTDDLREMLLKELSGTTSPPAVTTPSKNKELTIAAYMDIVINEGGLYADMVKKIMERVKLQGSRLHITRSSILNHIKIRRQKDKNYLKNAKFTDEGIVL